MRGGTPATEDFQARHEEGDRFKQESVYPLIASECEGIRHGPLHLLDLGTGTGMLAHSLKIRDGDSVTLVETQRELLGRAERAYSARGVNVQAIEGDVCHLHDEITRNSQDVVIASFVLNQVQYPEILPDLVSWYLRPGGLFIVVVPDEAYIREVTHLRTGKVTDPPGGVLEHTIGRLQFISMGYSVQFYARPNSYYLQLIERRGFNISEERIVDPSEKDIQHTPKALMIVGRKMEPVIGLDEKRIVTVVQDDVWTTDLRAVVLDEGRGHSWAFISEAPRRTDHAIPVDPSNQDIRALIEKSLSDDRRITIRQVYFRAANTKIRIVRFYDSQGRMIFAQTVRYDFNIS
jgi:ubiquinone/menaquinone biosynthesis C-methylase UbiE